MQQTGMPVVSMNQGMPVGSIPQSISMVQQLPVSIHIYFEVDVMKVTVENIY